MINTAIFEGRLTRDPELKTSQSGVEFMNFTVAWSDRYKEIETKCFLPCKAWRQTARFIDLFFKKGSPIALVGRLETEEWTDKAGEKHSRIVLNVDRAHFWGNKAADQPREVPGLDGFVEVPDGADEELPFT